MTDQQSPKLSATEFVDLVVASGLLEREDVERTMAAFPPAEKGRTVARHLVETGKLTRFQASRLLRGKTEGFQFGQYRILEELGRGGMGRVYKAVHQAMGRFVALKLLAPDLTRTDKARTLFQREVKAAAKLHHPNIVTAYDAYHDGDRYFLVMEFVDGPNLSQLVRERGPLPVEQACEYIRQTAIGLGYAHAMGLVHRDVKPANLLVQQTPGGPQVKILDFGLAIITTGEEAALSQTASTGVPGTPDYMAPEQAKDHLAVDGRADLYSLGCTFYFLLTAEVPFPGGTALEKVTRHGSEAPRAVQSLRPEIPDAVATVVHKLLAKNPKWRYEKAADLAADLENVLNGRRADWSAPARPPALPRRSEPLLNPGSGDDVWSEAGELDGSSNSTMPSTMATRETPTSDHIRRRPPRPRKPIWPWVVLAVALAFGVVAGMGLVLKAIVERGAAQ
ncbi:MAG TPA: serine/threonine-protein kinase [Gemmataceae bacterium]|nr:serine/threonine-protein kinase [Gemmataceae bacterium]